MGGQCEMSWSSLQFVEKFEDIKYDFGREYQPLWVMFQMQTEN